MRIRVRRFTKFWRWAAIVARFRNRPMQGAMASTALRRKFSEGTKFCIPLRLAAIANMIFSRKTICFFPQCPSDNYIISKLCAMSGHRVVGDLQHPHDVIFKFDAVTYSEPKMIWKGIPDVDRAINGRSFDVSKRHVESVFELVFGYSYCIDPLRHVGIAVEKNNGNGLHDAVIVTCPMRSGDVKSGFVYEKLLDNTFEDGAYYLDYRVPVIDGCIPFVYEKFILASMRFKKAHSIKIVETDDVFSKDEQEKLLRMSGKMHLDIGEIDVLRDNENGQIYVVDVNNTPWGPAKCMGPENQRKALVRMRGPFERLVDRFSL